MPLFGSKSKSKDKEKDKKSYERDQEDNNLPAPILPPPPPPETPKANVASPDAAYHTQKELVFRCQLAHGSATKEIKDFTNVKDMYARIGSAFEISPREVSNHAASHDCSRFMCPPSLTHTCTHIHTHSLLHFLFRSSSAL